MVSYADEDNLTILNTTFIDMDIDEDDYLDNEFEIHNDGVHDEVD